MNCLSTAEWRRGLRTGVLAILIAGTAAAAWKEGSALPDLKKAGLEGTLPAELRGKVILVDFWASWCAPCKASFPVLDELQKTYKNSGLVVLGVNVDEKADDMRKFIEEHPVAFTSVRDARQSLVSDADVQTMPSSFLVDRRGRIRFVHAGFRGEATRKQYVEEIEKLLKETP